MTTNEPEEDLLWDTDGNLKNPRVTEYLKGLVREYGAVVVQDALDETTSGAFLEYVGTDAQKWASEFCGMFGGDEGTMIGWFANAIEAGRSAGQSRANLEETVPYSVWKNDVMRLLEIARKVQYSEMSETQSRDYGNAMTDIQERLRP